MMRVRRRCAFILCGVCSAVFLVLYLIISYAAPAELKKPNFGAIVTKLERLEDGLQRHGQEIRHLEDRLDQSVQQKRQSQQDGDHHQSSEKRERAVLADTHSQQLGVGSEECSFDTQQVPQPDIQMLDMCNEMSFADVDGGVWKQGWNVKYDPLRFNEHHKLKVFVVPHSHNDPGWVKTFDDYYEHDTKHILSNALRHLQENPDMTFIWAEISFFARFYEDLGQRNKKAIKQLVQNKQLEFVTGGWVMPDEANSHWLSVLLQLTEGQDWLKKHLNVTPISSWSIDPFGHSPTLPYILKKSGFQNLLIQRTHYSVKKELALKRHLEFYWRQLWDTTGATDLFTHMMPFYSYDIPHTCGPDPKICCQFDFKRMHEFGLSCPWGEPARPIDTHNVVFRAEMLVDQWKKKAELYRTNALLIPLGDDFRYSQSIEWSVQRVNYEALFEHINSQPQHYVEAKFGTLQEYFDAVQQEKRAQQRQFPTLSGDFFTYADRGDNYWSGYYTSRPYYKRMDRLLLHYVRAAELLHAWSVWEPLAKFDEMLQTARRELSLFQHHDGITGTAKTHVVSDYALRMTKAISHCRFVMQQAVYRLLTKPTIYNADYKFSYFYLDESRWPGPDDSRTTIILGEELPAKHVVFHNSLSQWREELVDFYISSPLMSVFTFDGQPVEAQVAPVWSWHRDTLSNTITPQASTTKYRLVFKARVPPLGLVTYIIRIQSSDAQPAQTSQVYYASNQILTTNPISVNLGSYPHEVKFGEHRALSLHVGDGPTVAFSSDGLLKSIQLEVGAPHTPIKLKFYKYGTRPRPRNSGAYLFLPNGVATELTELQPPVVLVTEGPLEASVTVGLSYVVHQTVLRGGPPEVRNLVDIANLSNTELVMRLSTHIKSDQHFYTDLNGLQMIKRRRLSKIPLQANYYPIPSAIYIEDEALRLTVVTAQPLGGSSLSPGEVEIMQDRRLLMDDNRGLDQGVLDNRPVLHLFRIVLERIGNCLKPADTHPAGVLTRAAHLESKSLLHPFDKFIFIENDWLGVLGQFGAERIPAEDDIEVVVVRNLAPTASSVAIARDRQPHARQNTGVIVHRTHLLQCSPYDQQTGVLNMLRLLRLGGDKGTDAVFNTTLTFLQRLQQVQNPDALSLCPLDTQAFVVQHTDDGLLG